jgi:7,8-dihydro-6-hydroxymethylpterin-pyrophosphokinase
MDGERAEALAVARKRVGTLESAPNPLRQAQTAVAGVLRTGPWGAAAERQILDLAAWLATRPPPSALKLRCQSVLRTLD